MIGRKMWSSRAGLVEFLVPWKTVELQSRTYRAQSSDLLLCYEVSKSKSLDRSQMVQRGGSSKRTEGEQADADCGKEQTLYEAETYKFWDAGTIEAHRITFKLSWFRQIWTFFHSRGLSAMESNPTSFNHHSFEFGNDLRSTESDRFQTISSTSSSFIWCDSRAHLYWTNGRDSRYQRHSSQGQYFPYSLADCFRNCSRVKLNDFENLVEH